MHAALPSIGATLRDLLQSPPPAAAAAAAPRPFPALADASLLGRALLCAPAMAGLHSRVQWPPLRAEAMRCAHKDGCRLTGKKATSAIAAASAAAAAPPVAAAAASTGRPRQPSPPAPAFSSADSHAAAAVSVPVAPASANPWNRHVPAPPSASASASAAAQSRDARDASTNQRANPAGGGGGAYQRDDGPPSSQQQQYRNGAGRRGDDDESDGGRFKRPRGSNSSVSSASPTPPDPDAAPAANPFVTGTDKLMQDAIKKHGSRAAAEAALKRDREASASAAAAASTSSTAARSLGGKRFVPPYAKKDSGSSASSSGPINPALALALAGPHGKEGEVHPRLQGLDPKLIEMITMDMMSSPGVKWDDIAGLEFAKKTIKEIVVWPLLRPDMFTGLRGPPKGLLLFGPPGTGKTLIGKCVASESRCKFFSISASSLTSKWHGEGEKLVRTLFAVANVHEPSIIFIDEIDSLLSQRQDAENEAGRRIKTEFLVQLDGCNTTGKERVLVVGATNRPQELDEAARRRLVKKLYIPLPDYASRMQLLVNTMKKDGVDHCLTEADFVSIVNRAAGYSGSDMAALCTESSMGPIRSLSSVMDTDDISKMDSANVRPIARHDFDVAFKSIRPSVNQKDLAQYVAWNRQYGSFPMAEGEDIFCSTPPRVKHTAEPTTETQATTPAAAAGSHAEQKEQQMQL